MRNRSSRLKVIKQARTALDQKRQKKAQAEPCPDCGLIRFAGGIPPTVLMSSTPGAVTPYCETCATTAEAAGANVVSLSTPSRDQLRERIANEYGG